MSQSNYQSYNVTLAHKLGLQNAIYLNIIISIYGFAVNKHTLVEEKYFYLDRKYISSRTTFSEHTQLELENNLVGMGIMEKYSDNIGVSINLNVVTSILSDGEAEVAADLSKIKKMANKASKNDWALSCVKKNIKADYPEELKREYREWLDIINRKFNFVSNSMLEQAEKLVDDYANSNLDAAIGVVKIAQANGWKDMQWAVNRHRENSNKIIATKNSNFSTMDGVVF